MKAEEFHQARKFADTTFGRIAYVEKGTGPAALFVHGFPLNGFAWRGTLEDLAATRRCIALDLMGWATPKSRRTRTSDSISRPR